MRPAAAPPADQVTGYICPMHPDVVIGDPASARAAAWTLVAGNPLGTANYRLAVETAPGS